MMLTPTATTIPVTITPEAEAFIDRVGQRAEFEAILEYTKQTVPGLRAVEVTLDEWLELGSPSIVISATRDEPGPGDDPTHWRWNRWMIESFPPEVGENFVMLPRYLPAERRVHVDPHLSPVALESPPRNPANAQRDVG